MLEEQKASPSACSSFEQHRFKGHLCVHCFKPKAAHVERPNEQMDTAEIKPLDNDVNKVEGIAGKATRQKYDVPKVILRNQNNQNNLQRDAKGRGERQVDRNNRKRAKDRTRELTPHNAKRDVASKPTKKAMTLNIPLESGATPALDNKASASSESTNAGMNSSDSCSENGSVNINVFTDKQASEQNGNFYPSEVALNGGHAEQFRKVLRPKQKAGSPPKTRERNRRDPELPEFLKVAKNLRHIEGMGIAPSAEIHSSNNNHSVVETEDMLPDLPDLPNMVGSDVSMKEQQKLVDSKSKLPMSIVMTSQATMTGHETLPKNMGKSRPSITPLTKHRRQTSDPEVFAPSAKEETLVVNMSKETNDISDDVQTENVVVRGSHLSSDVYFGKSPVASPQKRASSDAQQDSGHQYGHIAECVTIISQTGEVSHQYKRDKAGSSSREIEDGPGYDTPVSRTNPYRVVDLNDNRTKNSERDSNSAMDRNGSPSSSGVGRMSQELDEGLGLAQQDEGATRSKDPSARFSRRNVALVDGIYTATQFNTDSGINDSMESSDSSDGTKQETPSLEVDKRNTPPLPIILHDQQMPDYRKKKRNSGQYKVPIFIMPKGYDSPELNGVKRNSGSEIVGNMSPSNDQNIEYLAPKEKSSEQKPIIEHEAEGFKESKRVSLSNESLMDSRRPSRSRSKTHPVLEEDLSNSSIGKDQEQPEFSRTRLKRVAPRPPSMELTEQVFGRERDDRLDSLPHRSPPPPPLSKKESKQSSDRSSSDLSEENDRVSHPQASSNDRAKLEIQASGSSGRSGEVRRETSPTRRRDMSPLRDQHESRKPTLVKKESNFRARLREFSPTGRRDQSPTGRAKQKETPNKETQPSRRVASPPPPHNRPQPLNLPNTTATQDALAVKSKKSKLPWKRKKKRSDPGSPEREFNSEEVEKWLATSFSAASPASVSEAKPRNSLERLEVINAYKGEPTVAIKRVPQAATNAAQPSSPPHNAAASSAPIITNPNNKRSSVVETDDEELLRNAVNNASKRRAPNPPAANQEHEDVDSGDDARRLQKSYSLSPTSRRKNNRADESGKGEEHLYENLGANRANIAPQKPARRRQRNHTTGFEDMPTRIKRMAPKTPDKPTKDDIGDDTVDGVTSVESRARQLVFDDVPLSLSPPLKSALRSTVSEPMKMEANGKAAPKRPVRIIAPEDEGVATEPSHPTVLRSDYKNLALVPQVVLDDTIHQDTATQMEEELPLNRSIFNDAGTQCSLSSLNDSALDHTSQRSLLNDVNTIHLRALTQLSRTTPKDPLDWTKMEDSAWKDRALSSQSEPKCCSAGAAFFEISHPTSSPSSAAVMVCCDPSKSSQVLRIAEMTKSMSPQTNLISVSHATKDTVTVNPSLLEPRRTRGSPQTNGTVETALVVTDIIPTTNVAEYVSRNAEKHEALPDVYERDVALMLLQLCRGLCQLQSQHMCLESLKLDHLLLTDSDLPSGGQRLVINHLIGAEVVSSSNKTEMMSKLEQKCHEFDVGILVYEFLHQPNPFSTRTSLIISDYTESDLPDIPIKSPLTQGLHSIAAKLLAKKPQDRLTCSQAVTLLQCLLWGPPSTMYTDNAVTSEALNQVLEQWLVAQRASMVTRVALLSLIGGSSSQEKTGFTLPDQLHCEYLSDVTVETCREAMASMYSKSTGGELSVIDSEIDL